MLVVGMGGNNSHHDSPTVAMRMRTSPTPVPPPESCLSSELAAFHPPKAEATLFTAYVNQDVPTTLLKNMERGE